MPARIEFCWSRRKIKLITLGMAFVIAIGIPMIVYGDRGAQILGGIWIAGFAALLFALLRRAKSTLPVVIVDSDGILDRRVFDQPIAWTDITSLERIEAEHMVFLGIGLTGQAQTRNQARMIVRWMRVPNKLMGMPPFSISMSALDGSLDDLVAAIANHRPDLVARMKG